MLVNFVLVLTILLGCCGLGLDVGLLELKRMQMQNAADAAAMGALFALERGGSAATWLSSGRSDAGLNGFVNGTNGVVVNIVNPPATGSYTLNYGAVQATVSQPVATVFMGQSINVTAQATALMPPCVYLSTTVPGGAALFLQSAGISATCPVYSSPNEYVDGFSNSRYNSNYVTGIAAASGGGGNIYNPTYNFPVMADPLSYLAAPSFSFPCNFLGLSVLVSTTLNPGVYCGTLVLPGLTILGGTITFNPGLYIISGGLAVTGATLNSPNGGVTLYMTKGGLSLTYGQILINGGSVVNLNAPSDNSFGGIPGILIFGDRNWVNTSATNQDILLTTCSINGDGIFYFPKTGIYDYRCPIAPAHYAGLVLDSLGEFVGSSVQPKTNFSSVWGGNPFRPRESLVE